MYAAGFRLAGNGEPADRSRRRLAAEELSSSQNRREAGARLQASAWDPYGPGTIHSGNATMHKRAATELAAGQRSMAFGSLPDWDFWDLNPAPQTEALLRVLAQLTRDSE